MTTNLPALAVRRCHSRHAPPGTAWRASCERRFAVPLMRVRQVRALSFAGQALQEGKR